MGELGDAPTLHGQGPPPDLIDPTNHDPQANQYHVLALTQRSQVYHKT